MSSRIQVLEPNVANRIAAGEVVERPASVVKELVENALDARATRISVDVEKGGKKRIRVTDNGMGMSREDAETSLHRHATSKLRRSEDLEEIATLGFRGEALPSIASVALFRMVTRTEESPEATEVAVEGGDLKHLRSAGGPVGTEIEVRSLFSHVPARRKFLKTDATEWGHIEGFLQRCALCHPQVHWEWRHNTGPWHRLPACSNRDERVFQVFGSAWRDETVAVEASAGDRKQWRLTGRVSLPSLTRKNRREQFWFVNGRPVSHPGLTYALREAYGARISRDAHPLAVLFLECPGSDIDVNVHPAKREIRLRNEAAIRRFLVESIDARLREDKQTTAPTHPRHRPATDAPALDPEPTTRKASEVPPRVSFKPLPASASQQEWATEEPVPTPARSHTAEDPEEAGEGEVSITTSATTSGNLPFKIIGLTEPGLILGENEEGLILVHVVAAFERIYFEECLEKFLHEQMESQRLLVPVTIDFDPETAAFLNEASQVFEKSGISMGPVGGNSFMVDALPPAACGKEPEQFIRGLIESLQAGDATVRKIRSLEDERFAAVLARQLSRGRRVESAGEMAWLIDRLHACDLPYTRPDGRPTMTLLSRHEFKRRFQVD